MSQKLDFLYNAIYIQHNRYSHFNATRLQGQWSSRSSDETAILDNLIAEYIKYFYTKAEEMSKNVTDIKEYNVNSYLTRDTQYYIDQFNTRIAAIEKYTENLETVDCNTVLTADLTSFGDDLDALYPDFIKMPALFGQLVEVEEKTKEE